MSCSKFRFSIRQLLGMKAICMLQQSACYRRHTSRWLQGLFAFQIHSTCKQKCTGFFLCDNLRFLSTWKQCYPLDQLFNSQMSPNMSEQLGFCSLLASACKNSCPFLMCLVVLSQYRVHVKLQGVAKERAFDVTCRNGGCSSPSLKLI